MPKHRIVPRRLVVVAACLLICATAMGRWPMELSDAEGNPTLAPVLERATAAVVNVKTERPVRTVWRRLESVEGGGSGVIIDAERGHIVTNHHVVEGATSISVSLKDEREFEATIVGTDPQTDIALLQIEADSLSAMTFRDSDELRVGDFVIAIGSPFGFAQTVTYGIVSATGRRDVTQRGLENFIQTDASINPGNSGGALIDLRGRLVGINTLIYSRTGGNVGIGFAIPSNMTRTIVSHLARHGEFRRGFLGVSMLDFDAASSTTDETASDGEVVVQQVFYGSAAADAGIHVGDVVLAIDGEAIVDVPDLQGKIAFKQPGEEIDVTLKRNGEQLTLKATTGEATLSRQPVQPEVTALEGALFSDIAPARRSQTAGGVMIEVVRPGSVADQAGLMAGDVLTSVGRYTIHHVWSLRATMQHVLEQRVEPTIWLVRGGEQLGYTLSSPPRLFRVQQSQLSPWWWR